MQNNILFIHLFFKDGTFKMWNIPFMLDETLGLMLLLRKETLFCPGETGFPSLWEREREKKNKVSDIMVQKVSGALLKCHSDHKTTKSAWKICNILGRLPGGLEREVVEGELQQSGALIQSQVLGGSTIDVVDQI